MTFTALITRYQVMYTSRSHTQIKSPPNPQPHLIRLLILHDVLQDVFETHEQKSQTIHHSHSYGWKYSENEWLPFVLQTLRNSFKDPQWTLLWESLPHITKTSSLNWSNAISKFKIGISNISHLLWICNFLKFTPFPQLKYMGFYKYLLGQHTFLWKG